MTADLQEQAAELQKRFSETRRAWAADPENGLTPWPLRRTKRRPEPGTTDQQDEELG